MGCLVLKVSLRKNTVLLAMLLVLALLILLLVYFFLSNPATNDVFILTPSEQATRELDIATGQHVTVWLFTAPPGYDMQFAQPYVIKFYVTNPENHTVLDTFGIAGTGPFPYLTFVAHDDGVYTMHFDNTVGGSFDKTVRLSYRIVQTFFEIPIEYHLWFILVATVIIILVLVVAILLERSRARIYE